MMKLCFSILSNKSKSPYTLRLSYKSILSTVEQVTTDVITPKQKHHKVMNGNIVLYLLLTLHGDIKLKSGIFEETQAGRILPYFIIHFLPYRKKNCYKKKIGDFSRRENSYTF